MGWSILRICREIYMYVVHIILCVGVLKCELRSCVWCLIWVSVSGTSMVLMAPASGTTSVYMVLMGIYFRRWILHYYWNIVLLLRYQLPRQVPILRVAGNFPHSGTHTPGIAAGRTSSLFCIMSHGLLFAPTSWIQTWTVSVSLYLLLAPAGFN